MEPCRRLHRAFGRAWSNIQGWYSGRSLSGTHRQGGEAPSGSMQIASRSRRRTVAAADRDFAALVFRHQRER